MLDALDQIPWSTLEHAYGSAEDMPSHIRALLSDEEDTRKRAWNALQSGPFHQGSIYTCTPYVARFLIEIAQHNTVPRKALIFLYLAQLDQAARWRLEWPETLPNDDVVDEWSGMTNAEWRHSEREIAQQIRDELQPYNRVFLQALNDSVPEVRRSAIPYLLVLSREVPDILPQLQTPFADDDDDNVRACLALALGPMLAPNNEPFLRTILNNESESMLVRLAVGFGWLAQQKDKTPDHILSRLATLITDHAAAMSQLDGLHQTMLLPGRLLEGLLDLSSQQRHLFVRPLINVALHLPLKQGVRLGGAHYRDILVQLAFPNRVLPAEAMIHDLTDVQRAVLETIQAHHVRIRQESLWYFQDVFGLELASVADFQAFIGGHRSARQAGSEFDQKMVRHLNQMRRQNL
jgi:hypothetical protein